MTRRISLPLLASYREAKSAGDARTARRLLGELVTSQLGLVRMVANRTTYGKSHRDDAVQNGSIGLLRAIETYDPARSEFSTYAVPHIIGAIAESPEARGMVGVQREVGRPPRKLAERVAAAREAGESAEDLAKELGRRASPVRAWLKERPAVTSSEVDHVHAHPGANPERLAIARQELALVAGALAAMRPFEQAVIAALDEERDDEAVAREWRLGTRWLRRTRANAREKLAQAIEGKAA
jgi:RNA polymerase sigma factor (sigma-70 family)